MDGLAFLDKPGAVQPVYAVFGDDDFIKRQAVAVLRRLVLGDGDAAEFSLSRYEGAGLDFSTARNELATPPFVGERRLIVVDPADEFVSEHRAKLEKYTAAPAASGVLLLVVKTWKSNTKLAKQLPAASQIQCDTPKGAKLTAWCVAWAKKQHGKKLEPSAAQLLLETVEPDLGQLDRELDKLAAYAGDAPAITAADVDKLVGRSRAAETFKIFDALGKGDAGRALTILGRLFDQQEEPLQLLGAFSWQLRKLSQIARLVQAGRTIDAAMGEAEVPNWPAAREGARSLVRHLGERRLAMLLDWLVEANLQMKSSDSLPRLVLERLLVRLAAPRAAV